ncbi:E3 ubiquitin/ISG15 ligase TRIM25-like [Gambusia affinis]|uniref:E3 ubiquitin/ISG15 ligase TRIM25-like n=1 Tax=Gambusia affinis TaxID=33528 RepID=UPI001CDC52C2|nr:E3 ubiquitin/ISG15 ligase TRIM25-like [Gambusia affinis]XP_043954661.1 E3 ubiquitin/ISG15 ligase TRIM25-like [Gambusia affinis]XP_043954662.1 E3 ubiquitin/ISG15 ligase TRIM25-like [Gambusia affinis]XP_043954663.1 E3 ubiquitin/ISG15 ligase TRIM25-like [Gambusia affinis]XP_043954664.1 E3 ubiquitin/ISG15 ligase TRIM25-like [Gambusia affinis]
MKPKKTPSKAKKTPNKAKKTPSKAKLQQEAISCSICLDPLKSPVTIACGHSYCMSCINVHWDREDHYKVYTCPQCRQSFTPRPVLVKSTALADLVEQLQLKDIGLNKTVADHCYAGPEDVVCDVCTGRKLKAVKSCLTCPASYCENHLQPHHDAPPLKKHKLVNPSKNLQENICSRHDEMMKIFCRTDQQCICYLCLMDGHKDHETVPAAAERAEKHKKLQESRQQIHQRIQDQEKDVKLLQQEVEAINVSADKAVEDSEKIFTELIRLLQERSSDVKQQIRSQQETEVSRVKDVQEKLEQEITELKRKDAELEQLSHTEDHTQFLLNYPSLPALSESKGSSSINIRPLRHFEDVTAAVSQLRDKLKDILTEDCRTISCIVSDVDVLLAQPDAMSRADFLKFSVFVSQDLNTMYREILLPVLYHNTRYLKENQSHHFQVMSKLGLFGRNYWEVEWRGGGACVAAAYRSGTVAKHAFGFNKISWALNCTQTGYTFYHNSVETPALGPVSSRVGVYLDHSAGILSFYSVSGTMTLLYRVWTTFTQAIYPGLRFQRSKGDTASFIEPQ